MIDFLKKGNNLLYAGLVLLTVVNIIQGYTTELLSDEAYYWVYRQFMDFGYFDHPPMVAVWIWISNFFVESSELSVRFFSAITLSATIYFIWKLIDHPKKQQYNWLFLLVVLSTALFNAYGFITVPDTPLLFFMVIFLLGYKKYLEEKSTFSYVILAIAMAGMMYSKYQAVLVIGFVLLSNLKVLKDYKMWLAGLGALLLFFPHLYWQYANDFPSFRYHLLERTSSSRYAVEDTIMHLVNAIAIIGLTFPVVYYSFYKNLKTKDLFNKALNFIIIGFIVFFFFSTFRGHVQAQWIVPISIPLMLITFNYLISDEKKRKLFTKLAVASIVILSFGRFFIANNLLPIQLDFHGNKTWVNDVKNKIDGRKPLIFNTYQNAATYWFYSKDTVISYAHYRGRKNQYSLKKLTDVYQNKNVAHLYNERNAYTEKAFKIRNSDSVFVSFINGFKDGLFVSFNIESEETSFVKNTKNKLLVLVTNPYNYEINTTDLHTFVVFINDKKETVLKSPAKLIFNENTLSKNTTTKGIIEFNLPVNEKFTPEMTFEIIGKSEEKLYLKRMSGVYSCTIK